jgi:hypothetical protein
MKKYCLLFIVLSCFIFIGCYPILKKNAEDAEKFIGLWAIEQVEYNDGTIENYPLIRDMYHPSYFDEGLYCYDLYYEIFDFSKIISTGSIIFITAYERHFYVDFEISTNFYPHSIRLEDESTFSNYMLCSLSDFELTIPMTIGKFVNFNYEFKNYDTELIMRKIYDEYSTNSEIKKIILHSFNFRD